MENSGYLFAAFSVVLIGILIYTWMLMKLQRKLQREINLLEEELKKMRPES